MAEQKNRPIHRRFRDGIAGLTQGWRRERSIRLHVLLAAPALAVVFLSKPHLPWLVAFLILLVLGLAIELINASLEALLDRLHPAHDAEIGAAKDLGSAAALVVNAAAAGAFLGALLL
ncbi:MAG: diacylglycerol kinase [Sphingomicrobium sp.]